MVSPGDTVLLRYTSGSTGDPKGVVLAHRHVLANLRVMALATQVGPAAPNVAFELCLRVPDAEIEHLDLSGWRLSLNGAEPVLPSTARRFTDRFSRFGFRPEVMFPVCGLAESALGATFSSPGGLPRVDVVERDALVRTGAARPRIGAPVGDLELVSCGRPLPGYQVDAAGHEVADRHEGRIELTGPSATPGYFRDDPGHLRHGTWADTGDLGYVAEGELYLTGRAKDVIIRAGQNLHPEELEQAVGALPGIRTGCVAAFSSPEPALGTERLVVVAETRVDDAASRDTLRQRVVATTVDVLGSPPGASAASSSTRASRLVPGTTLLASPRR